eukprot:7610075-Pyramimonas_sp.AAC.1
MQCLTAQCHPMLCHATLCRARWRLFHAMPCRVLQNHAMLCDASCAVLGSLSPSISGCANREKCYAMVRDWRED